LTKEECTKIAQFVVEDGNAEVKLSISKKIAKQIFRNLFKRELYGPK
jgi:RNase P protein component